MSSPLLSPLIYMSSPLPSPLLFHLLISSFISPQLQLIISLGGRARGASPYGGGDSLLHAAVKRGDADFVGELVEIGTELDSYNHRAPPPPPRASLRRERGPWTTAE
tara:strand:- start:68 stop:388 length:321 start_codon:yes stop_codon:yes gene_type:complete